MSWKMNIQKKTGVQHYRHITGLLAFTLLFFTCLATAVASGTREHSAHVHGIGQLNIALDGNDLMLELRSPAANIVGFEHAPETEQQTHALYEAMELLKDGEKLFALTTNAGCSLHDAHVESELAKVHHEKGDSHHSEHEAAHSGDEHDGETVHSEFETIYHFKCVHPEKLKSIDVQVFSFFPGFEELEVQLLTPKTKTAVELTPKNSRISL